MNRGSGIVFTPGQPTTQERSCMYVLNYLRGAILSQFMRDIEWGILFVSIGECMCRLWKIGFICTVSCIFVCTRF